MAFNNIDIFILSPQRTFVKQKGSSDVKGSLWNHLDKKGFSMASWNTFIFYSVHLCCLSINLLYMTLNYVLLKWRQSR